MRVIPKLKITEIIHLEVRICPSCKRSFKCAPTSPSVFDSRFCEWQEQHRQILNPARISFPEPETITYQEMAKIPKRLWRRRAPRMKFS